MQIDFDFGLSQLSGNEALLIKLLAKIKNEYADCESRLNTMFADGQWEDARVLIHTLKGVSGNLGCVALHQACKTVDAEIKHDDQIPPSISLLFSTLKSTLSQINAVESAGSIAAAAVSETNENNADLSVQAKQELIGLLNDNAFIPPDVLTRTLHDIALSAEDSQQLEQCVNMLDYKRALEILTS